jgi:hypothetical protein
MTPASRGRALPSWLAVLGAQLALVAFIYGPTLKAGFVSDAWVYLAFTRQGTAKALLQPIGYHWQPVAVGWVALIRGLFGDRAIAFQVVHFLQLATFGLLAYLLGRRLIQDARASLLGSLLAVASAVHYEASYWPLAGNMHLLAVQLYLVSLLIAHDVAKGRLPRSGPWVLCLAMVAAVFTHPAMVTVIPVCGVLILLDCRDRRLARREALSFAARLGWPLAVTAGLFGLVKVLVSAHLYAVPQLGFDRDRFYWLSARGLAGVFSLRGSADAFVSLLTFGSAVRWPDRRIWWFVGCWMLAAALASALWAWRARSPGVRFLLAFLAIHLVALTVGAGGVASRQSQLLAVPAALLAASALGALAARASRRWGRAAAALVVAAPLALLLPGAYHDHRVAARLALVSGDLARQVVAHVRARTGPGKKVATVTLVNMPPILYEQGISIFAFHNGVQHLVELASRSAAVADLRQFPLPNAPAVVTPGSEPIAPQELNARTTSPLHLVLLFEEKPMRVRVLDATSP